MHQFSKLRTGRQVTSTKLFVRTDLHVSKCNSQLSTTLTRIQLDRDFLPHQHKTTQPSCKLQHPSDQGFLKSNLVSHKSTKRQLACNIYVSHPSLLPAFITHFTGPCVPIHHEQTLISCPMRMFTLGLFVFQQAIQFIEFNSMSFLDFFNKLLMFFVNCHFCVPKKFPMNGYTRD